MPDAVLDDLAARSWPALTTAEVDGWRVRLAGGVTQRANSVLPVAAPADVPAAIAEVERLYAAHGQQAVFQIGDAALPTDLDAVLAARGYERRSPTEVRTAAVQHVLARTVPDAAPGDMVVAEDPDDAWAALWWGVDSRGGPDQLATGLRILRGAPALYGSYRESGEPAAVARLAILDGWGVLACVVAHPEHRRRGLATAVTRALLSAAAEQGVTTAMLQVVRSNDAARALYDRQGWAVVGGYHYRARPLP